jgi:hypothetical protein
MMTGTSGDRGSSGTRDNLVNPGSPVNFGN